MISFKGQGGKELEYQKFCNDVLGMSLERTNKDIYDFFDKKNNKKIELKKQMNQQWFDACKFSDISEQDSNIFIHFLIYDKNTGEVNTIHEIPLNRFIEISFTKDYINWCKGGKNFPKHQSKMSMNMKDEFVKHPNDYKKIYQK